MKTVLITGAYRGIGFEVARQLAKRDFHVFITARKSTAGEKAAKTIGEHATFVPLDVTDEQSIRGAVASVTARTAHLDVVINNAAIVENGEANVLTVDAAVARRTFETNTIGPLRVAQAFLPLLLKSKSPRIINVSSGAGQLSDMGTWAPAYSISKAALNALTGQLAAVLRDKGVAVNSVCPGWCRTEMGGPSAPRSVEQGADTIVWLAAEAPAKLTGQFLRDRKPIPW